MLSTVWKSSQPRVWHVLPQWRTRRVVLPKHNMFMQQIICRGIFFIDILATLNRHNFNELSICSCTLSSVSFLDPENYFVHFVSLGLWCLQDLLLFMVVHVCFSLTATEGNIIKMKPAYELSLWLFPPAQPYTLHWRQSLLPCTGLLGEKTNVSVGQGEGRNQNFYTEICGKESL